VVYESKVRWTWERRTRVTVTGDISCGGVFIVSDDTPPVGTPITLELELENRDAEVDATVTWSGISRQTRGFGAKFEQLDRDTFQHIRQLVHDREE
jgi:hypothetical protein